MAEGGSRRRNLRPRKQFLAEEPSFHSRRRHLRQSRSRVKPDDFLVFANEEDGYGDNTESADEVDEMEASDEEVENSPNNRRSRRASRRNTAPSVTNGSKRTRGTTRGTPRSSSARANSSNRSSGKAVLPSSSRSARASRRRGNLDIDVVMEDAAAQDDSSSYSSQDEDEDEDIEDEENDLEDDEELEFGKARELFRNKPKRRRPRAPKVLLPEDVPLRSPYPDQPLEDPVDIQHTPSIAFLAIFVATFYDLFADFGVLPSPQDLEEGLISEEPSPLVELLFRRLLLLVLNRKKELEVGRYGSALSELHSLRATLGQGPWFPPLNWKSRASAFQELNWADRVELLHVLVHWSMANSDRVKALLKNIGDELTMPWMGADEHGNHYYIVGFDPIAENSQEYTRFRVYKESNRLLSNVSWKPVASNAAEVVEFLKQHQIKEDLKGEATPTEEETKAENEAKDETKEGISQEPGGVKYEPDTAETEVPVGVMSGAIPGEITPGISSDPSKYNLPATVVEILTNLLPSMYLSEEVASARIARENKRARRRNFLWHPEPISRDEGRHRRRRNRVDFFDFVRQSDGIDDGDDSNRKRRRRDEPWTESEPETRQQRHARLLADKQERIQSEPAEEVTDAAEHLTPGAVVTKSMSDEALQAASLDSPLPSAALLPTPPMIPAVQEKMVEPTVATSANQDLNK